MLLRTCYQTLNHVFKIAVVQNFHTNNSIDLYEIQYARLN